MGLADVNQAHDSLPVRQVDSRPVPVVQAAPVAVVVVQKVRIGDFEFLQLLLNRFAVLFVGELRGVDADDPQAPIRVFALDFPDPGKGTDAVDSAEGPDVEEDHLSLEVGHRKGGRIEPTMGRLGGKLGEPLRQLGRVSKREREKPRRQFPTRQENEERGAHAEEEPLSGDGLPGVGRPKVQVGKKRLPRSNSLVIHR